MTLWFTGEPAHSGIVYAFLFIGQQRFTVSPQIVTRVRSMACGSSEQPVIRSNVPVSELQPNYHCKMAAVILYTYATDVYDTP